ncbi:MAG TPA: hypothetical protein VFE47_23835 [Tepidisphaeraceae bacterium]|jgi:hypothetical protein|nr:hypothetical protein [Tepidisphaeraceae bacterium]
MMGWRRIVGIVALPVAISASTATDLRAGQSSAVAAPFILALDEVPATAPSQQDADTRPAVVEPPSADDFRPSGFVGFQPQPTPAAGVQNNDFYPTPDRWRVGIPGNYIQNTRNDSIFDPYSQNLLKGDYALPGTQNQFLVLTMTSDTLIEARRNPTPSGVSTRAPEAYGFFGNGNSQMVQQNFIISADYFIGDAAYQPRDFEIRATGVLNGNYFHTHELRILDPDVREGHDRTDYAMAAQELFVEKKLADLSPNYDFLSVRVGTQGFNNDFRGFLFDDNEPGVRLFGNYDNNRLQYNIAWFHQLEKDTHSGLNTFDARQQNVFFANVYRQDFLVHGYTAQLSMAANIDRSGHQYDTDGFLVRPAPFATVQSKKVDAYYIGWAGDGHIGRFNITHQFYQAFGRENFNPVAGREVNINAQFAAIELSYDADYIRYRTSFVYSSGDNNPQDGKAGGFDSIFDNPNFAGGGFNYFTRQAIALTGTGVNLFQRDSMIPDLRTSKEQGQANFVNPGLFLYNVGMDMDVTPELTLIGNVSYLRFDNTSSLQLLLQDNKIGKDIGVDFSLGAHYRPFLNNNMIITAGVAALVPGSGFKGLYSSDTLYSTFMAFTVTY